MRKLYIVATATFWVMVLAFWVGSLCTWPAGEPATAAAYHAISAAELAKHGRPDNCWMAIHGSVYDLTAYLPDHPSRPEVIEPWCGKDATEAYNTKTKGRPHSKAADEMLTKYRIGTFLPGGQ
jgi:cytochrome b involved in lipid metabolism